MFNVYKYIFIFYVNNLSYYFKCLNGICLADVGYAQTRYVYTSHLNPQIVQEKRYNADHIKTRNVINRVNEVLKSRLRCLLRKLSAKLKLLLKL